jgi:hypothetical protein
VIIAGSWRSVSTAWISAPGCGQPLAAKDIYVCDLQLKRCDSKDDAKTTVYNDIKHSPYHKEDSARAKEFMEKAEVECYEEDEQIYVATDDSDASCFPPPAERQPRKKKEQEARKASADAEKESKAAVKEAKRHRESRVRAAGALHTNLSGELSRISKMISDHEGGTANLVSSKEARDQAESVLAEVNSYIENPSVEMPGKWIETLEYVRFRIKSLKAKRPNAK